MLLKERATTRKRSVNLSIRQHSRDPPSPRFLARKKVNPPSVSRLRRSVLFVVIHLEFSSNLDTSQTTAYKAFRIRLSGLLSANYLPQHVVAAHFRA